MARREPRDTATRPPASGRDASKSFKTSGSSSARPPRESNDPIIHVALQVGIEDPSHFSRGFRQASASRRRNIAATNGPWTQDSSRGAARSHEARPQQRDLLQRPHGDARGLSMGST